MEVISEKYITIATNGELSFQMVVEESYYWHRMGYQHKGKFAEEYQEIEYEEVGYRFVGGKYGDHWLKDGKDRKRALAHWEGYQQSNEKEVMDTPKIKKPRNYKGVVYAAWSIPANQRKYYNCQ
jgi:hypothetical protein